MMDSPRTPSNTADAQAVATLQQLQQQSPLREQQQSPCGQQVALCAVRDWRFNKAAEDVEWLLTWSSCDGALVTSSWQVLYSISHAATWAQLQRFLLPRLTRVRGWCQGGAPPGGGSLVEGLYRPTPHAFQPWSRDAVLDWRYSRTREQLLFLVRRCSPASSTQLGDEWCELCVGDLSMWLLVKNYLLQALLLEAAYLAPAALPSPPTPDAAAAVEAASPVAGSNSPADPVTGAGEGGSPSSVAAAGSFSSGAGPWAQPCLPEGPWSHASQQQPQQSQPQQQEEEEDMQFGQQQLDVEEGEQQQQQPQLYAVPSPTDLQPSAPMLLDPQQAAAAQPMANYCPPLWGWLPPGGLPPPGWPPMTCPLPVLPGYPQQQLPGGSCPQVLPWIYDPATAAAMATGSDPRLQLSGPALPCAGDLASAFLSSPFASNTALVAAAAAAAAAVLAGYGGIARLGGSGMGPDASSSRAATATQVVLGGGPPTSMAADTGLAPTTLTRDGRFSMDGYACPSTSAALGGGEGWVRWESTGQLPGTLPCPGPSTGPDMAWPSCSGGVGGTCEVLAQPSCSHSR